MLEPGNVVYSGEAATGSSELATQGDVLRSEGRFSTRRSSLDRLIRGDHQSPEGSIRDRR